MKNYSDYDMESYKDLIDSLYSHANQELGFKKPPTLIFQSDPSNYGALAKTAQYDPSSQEITIYVDGRHIKDILRSFAHELVHHHQNEQGRLSGANVTQGEQDFDDIEGEAYHTGNLKLFRKWEDKLKQDSPTIYNERRIYKMSTKKWKNKELSNLMTEKFGYKMDLSKLNESIQEEAIEEAAGNQIDEGACSESEMEEGSCKPGPHEDMDEAFGRPEVVLDKIEKADCEDLKSMDSKHFSDKVKSAYDAAMAKCADKKEGMDEDDDSKFAKNQPPYDKATALDRKGPDGKHNKKNENLKEHKIWNDRGFKMDLNKLLK